MPLPVDLTTFTLTFGDYTNILGATALATLTGTIKPVDSQGRPVTLRHAATGRAIVPEPVTITIASDGTGSVGPLPHTDNAGLVPAEFLYRVEWNIASSSPSPGNATVAVPAASGSTVDFDLLVPVASAAPVSVVLPAVTSVAGYAGGVTAAQVATGLDADGNRLSDVALRAAFVALDSQAYARTVAGSPPPPPPQLTVIDTFQAGHTWAFANNAAGSDLARTVDPPIGSQYVRMVSGGAGAGTPVRLTKTGQTLNMTGKKFALLMRITNVQNLDNIFVYAGSAGFAAYNLFQIDRYLDARTKAFFREGEWAWITVGHEKLNQVVGSPNRASYADLRIAVVDKSGGNGVTADVAAIASVPETTTFPNGVVSFTFDDNWRTQYTLARPALDKHLFRGTFYTIADAVGTAPGFLGNEGSMTLADLQQLHKVGHEIAAHSSTLAHHNSAGGFTDLSPEELDAEHLAMKSWLKENGFAGYEHMAYPQGAYNPSVLASVRAWYTSARTVHHFARETFPPDDVHQLHATGLDNSISLAAVQTRVDQVKNGKGWLIILCHRLDPSTTNSLTWNSTDFQTLVDYVAASGVAVRTVGQVLATR